MDIAVTDPTPATDCYAPGASLMPLGEARRRVMEQIVPLAETESVGVGGALGRVLGRDLVSPADVPPHRNSAMDGYAVRWSSLPASGERDLRILGSALAGRPFAGTVGEGETVRVTTGAVMPDGTDTVVIQEAVQEKDGVAVLSAGPRSGENVRQAGEDIAAGDSVLTAGTRIGPAEQGVAASLGLAEVPVVRRPRVAVFSTGDELRSPGQSLDAGAIYDSNRYVIAGLLERMSTEVLDLGIIRDRAEDVEAALRNASGQVDVVITSGGVSTGSADYVTQALNNLGHVNVWRIAIRPGRPFAQGRIGPALFFGLPGNPVAVMVTFFQLVQPALRRLMGEKEVDPVPTLTARTLSRLRKKPDRTEVYRAVLERDDNGEPVVRSTGSQGSGLLSSMSVANCLVILDDDAVTVEPGAYVQVQPFNGLI